MNDAPSALLAAAEHAAVMAGDFLREQEGSQKVEAWSEKGRADYVTEVDRESERMVTAMLRAEFPDCVVVGEELNPELPRTAHRAPVFVVDPLDGTTNFLHRFPYYAVSIGAMLNGELLAGCVHHVVPRITYTASKGTGAFQDGKRIAVSTVTDPKHALIGTGYPFKVIDLLPQYLEQFSAIMRQTSGVRRAGSAALDLCDVATGRFDGFWELILAPWDIAAGALIVREAGGIITDFDGGSDVVRHGPIVAGNGTIQPWLLDLLKKLEA